MLQGLNDYLIKRLKQGHTSRVLIDEAQNLSAEALEDLRLLSNLETDQEKLLQIVLMGQPELERKLDQAETAPAQAAGRCSMPAGASAGKGGGSVY